MRLGQGPTLAFLVLLAGCAPPGPSPSGDVAVRPTRTAVPTATIDAPESDPASPDVTRTDTQGAVVFEVTPLNLSVSAGTLEFEVVMNTHSVDLGWDLAEQAVLSTDTGLEAQAASWPVGNGHHYGGVWPSRNAGGTSYWPGRNNHPHPAGHRRSRTDSWELVRTETGFLQKPGFWRKPVWPSPRAPNGGCPRADRWIGLIIKTDSQEESHRVKRKQSGRWPSQPSF
jgi:hypothetical protein